MGIGIAQVAASVACIPRVTLIDASPAQIERGRRFMDALLAKDVAKGKLTAQQRDAALGRLHVAADGIPALADGCDFVIEAVSENPAVKRDIFSTLASTLPEDAVMATNTSSISVTRIGASAGERADAVIGMHFMNPVPVIKLVEIIPGLATSDATLARTLALAHAMQKTTTMSRDMPGFIANRILMPYINEAIFALQDNISSIGDIDTTMKLGTNVPMGPLTLADFIGLDTCLAIMRVLHTQLGDSKYRPAPLLVQYVEAGYLGKKTGRGFYEYAAKP
ncbi:hypothetical protein CXG81DRAFT_15934 [Caulochytrium protostelioides]|uniref:3-hydroxybutyryl-CoA dehydrogenase n=1 Tax=Caulochytrium protostelioides TaxID=1555241 RepID=A0A4P9X0M2_9FUNG|nr:hypothetical protein CXG81DRAFT_15934 [Caulochytrium protostelioides]|eukprot:RKO98425.1 hypothetical protein CXG81DRAFT_15934 [Caulochytrium protostelioides]